MDTYDNMKEFSHLTEKERQDILKARPIIRAASEAVLRGDINQARILIDQALNIIRIKH